MLGWLECAVTPGFLLSKQECNFGGIVVDPVLVIASWYKRSESTLRSCMFFAMNTFFAIVFGLIMYLI
jgi:ACS family allantoate permease-like MFS transporter